MGGNRFALRVTGYELRVAGLEFRILDLDEIWSRAGHRARLIRASCNT